MSERRRLATTRRNLIREGSNSVSKVVRRFLSALWGANLEAALSLCDPHARLRLMPALPGLDPGPVNEVFPKILRVIYPRMEERCFEVVIDTLLTSQKAALLEYRLRGRLNGACPSECGHLAIVEFTDSRISRLSLYIDVHCIAGRAIARSEVARQLTLN